MNVLEYLSKYSNAVLTGEKVTYGNFKHHSNEHICPSFPFDKDWHLEWLDKQIESGVFETSNAVLFSCEVCNG